ncbi:MAG TPA: IucA/IucC family protein, partial [Kribbellaceae bacterium]|nr:IucA/IucC family protein [Kribbellaceae bacterium]
MSWDIAARRLLAKLVGQLCTEGLLQPVADGNGFRLDLGEVRYVFAARRGAFGSWRVDPMSIRRTGTGILGNDESEPASDPLRFVVDAAATLG